MLPLLLLPALAASSPLRSTPSTSSGKLAPLYVPPPPSVGGFSHGEIALFANAHSNSTSHLVPNGYIVKLAKGACPHKHRQLLGMIRAEEKNWMGHLASQGVLSFENELEGLEKVVNVGKKWVGLTGKWSDRELEKIRALEGVEYVERDSIVVTREVDSDLDDKYKRDQQKFATWGLHRISHRAKIGFQTFIYGFFSTPTPSGVNAYIIDTGVNIDHVELEGRAEWGKTMPKNDVDQDANGHGSHSLKLTEVAIVFPPPESDFHFDAADWKFQLEKLDWTHPRDKFTPSDVFLSLQILHPDPCSPSIRAFRLSYLSFGDPTHNNLFLSRLLYSPTSTSNPSSPTIDVFENHSLQTIQTRYPHHLLISTPTYELQDRTMYLDNGHPDSLCLFLQPLIHSIQQNTLPSLTIVKIGWVIDPDDPYQVWRGPMVLSPADYEVLQQAKEVASEKNILFECGDIVMTVPEASSDLGVGADANVNADAALDDDEDDESSDGTGVEVNDEEEDEWSDGGEEEGSDYVPSEGPSDLSYETPDEDCSDGLEESDHPGSEDSLKASVQSPAPSYNLLFLGTAASECIPTISCVTSSNPCLCCCLAHPATKAKFKPKSKSKAKSKPKSAAKSKSKFKAKSASASKCKPDDLKQALPNPNKRLNTSALITLPSGKTLLIDCGKSFRESALEFFPRNGNKVIDAVLLTHESGGEQHADAAYGLDDLCAWTLGGAIQPSLDVYCDQKTYDVLSRVFPYTIDRSALTGGGDVRQLSWHVFEDDQPLRLFGSTIIPLRVEHGVSASQSTPSSAPAVNSIPGRNPYSNSNELSIPGENTKEEKAKAPYYCLGYLIDDSIAYLSDVSQIPPPVWRVLHSSYMLTGRHLDVLVIDCLRLLPHTSHYGLPQALLTSSLLRPTRTYLTGFAHRTTHSQWISVGRSWSESGWSIRGVKNIQRLEEMDVLQIPPQDVDPYVFNETSQIIENAASGDDFAFVRLAREMTESIALKEILGDVACEVQGKAMLRQASATTWVRPAYDGLNVFIGVGEQGKRVWDDSPEEDRVDDDN
ncbi:hypothetical protein BT69DRAFT_1297824 [Atractiella rhizophila]|nr:hypothetical protein BT69DRAFT_1297824 [Atractiella rhizophila]